MEDLLQSYLTLDKGCHTFLNHILRFRARGSKWLNQLFFCRFWKKLRPLWSQHVRVCTAPCVDFENCVFRGAIHVEVKDSRDIHYVSVKVVVCTWQCPGQT